MARLAWSHGHGTDFRQRPSHHLGRSGCVECRLEGAAAGIGLAYVSLPALIARIPPEVPRLAEITLDWNVLTIVLASSIAVSITVALIPALVTARNSVSRLIAQWDDALARSIAAVNLYKDASIERRRAEI